MPKMMKGKIFMNKKRLISLLLAVVILAVALGGCNTSSSEPGKKNDKAPAWEDMDLDKEIGEKTQDVTDVTGYVAPNGEVMDNTGILDQNGHRIYNTGQHDENGNVIYSTGKLGKNGNMLYTTNKLDEKGEIVYYEGKVGEDGKIELINTNEKPDYSKGTGADEVMPTTKKDTTTTTTKQGGTTTTTSRRNQITTTTTVGASESSKVAVSDISRSSLAGFGGTGDDDFSAVSATSDGGYVTAGKYISTNGDYEGTSTNWQKDKSSVVKFGADGKKQWIYTLGGNNSVVFYDVTQLKDGTYIAAGYAAATDIGVTVGNLLSGLLVKLDKNGALVWKYVFEGTDKLNGDYIMAVEATPDGGFVVGGKSISSTGFFAGTEKYKNKLYIIKFDKNANVKWRQILGGSMHCCVNDLAVNSDGDIFAACFTQSMDGSFASFALGMGDSIIISLDKNGKSNWVKPITSTGKDEIKSIAATSDGGCIVGGEFTLNKSVDGSFAQHKNYGSSDAFLFKFNSNGNVAWSKTLGGTKTDSITSVSAVEGGYVVAGTTNSQDNDFKDFLARGEQDAFILAVNEKGEKVKLISLAGSGDDKINSIAVVSENSVVAVGYSASRDADLEGLKSFASGRTSFHAKYTVKTTAK